MRALHATGTDSVEQAITWMVEHEADPDLDAPLLVPKARLHVLLWLPAPAGRMLPLHDSFTWLAGILSRPWKGYSNTEASTP